MPRDFVDRVQAAELLGLDYPEAFYRLKDQAGTSDNPFPKPVHRISNSDVWSRTALLIWQAKQHGRQPPLRLVQRTQESWPEYAVDREQVASMLGITPPTVSRYASEKHRQPLFPEPIARYAGHPIWHRDDIARWARSRPGRGGAPRGPRPKGTCVGCGWARVLRADGRVIIHTWSPRGRIEQCPGSGELPRQANGRRAA